MILSLKRLLASNKVCLDCIHFPFEILCFVSQKLLIVVIPVLDALIDVSDIFKSPTFGTVVSPYNCTSTLGTYAAGKGENPE